MVDENSSVADVCEWLTRIGFAETFVSIVEVVSEYIVY
jgi:hypothetical protein